jgi:GT2 family glycosyltransferase
LSAVTILVPTHGGTPDLPRVAARLREEGARERAELLWIAPAGFRPPGGVGAGERIVSTGAPAGFARAANLGLAASAGDAALVNDDALVEPGWLARLREALARDAALAAAQGVNLHWDRPELADGCGLGWSRDWQAVQIGRDRPAPAPEATPFEIFGASATAALYRREALERAALAGGGIFDERLGSWYEDVELAGRLRARGGAAICLPAARALHRGSATGDRRPRERARLVARNRWWAAAALLGRRLAGAAPRMAARDLREAARRIARGAPGEAIAHLAGCLEALVLLGRLARAGPPLVAASELERLRVGSPA